MWNWAWAIPWLPKNSTFLSRRILDYAFDIPNIDVLPEKHRAEKHMIWPMQDPECRKVVVALNKQE